MITMTRNLPTSILAAALLFALSTGAVLAQSASSAPSAQHMALGPVDTNSDGKISAAEAQAASAKATAEIDSNRDGVITATELKAQQDRMQMLEMQRTLMAIDANHDGKTTTAEFSAMDTMRFKQVDKNNDGYVTPDEMRPQGQ